MVCERFMPDFSGTDGVWLCIFLQRGNGAPFFRRKDNGIQTDYVTHTAGPPGQARP